MERATRSNAGDGDVEEGEEETSDGVEGNEKEEDEFAPKLVGVEEIGVGGKASGVDNDAAKVGDDADEPESFGCCCCCCCCSKRCVSAENPHCKTAKRVAADTHTDDDDDGDASMVPFPRDGSRGRLSGDKPSSKVAAEPADTSAAETVS